MAVIVSTQAAPTSADARFDTQFMLELLLRLGHKLAGRTAVGLQEMADEPWIVVRPGRPHRQLVFNSCAEAGFTPRVAHEAAEWVTGAAMVAAGFGVCLVPKLARIPSGYPITRIPLRGDPAPSRHIRTVVRRGNASQPVIAEALEVLRDIAAGKRRTPRPRAGLQFSGVGCAGKCAAQLHLPGPRGLHHRRRAPDAGEPAGT